MYRFCTVASLRQHERETKKGAQNNVWLQEYQMGKVTGTLQEKFLRQLSFESIRFLVPSSSWQSAYCSRCWEVCNRFLQASPQTSLFYMGHLLCLGFFTSLWWSVFCLKECIQLPQLGTPVWSFWFLAGFPSPLPPPPTCPRRPAPGKVHSCSFLLQGQSSESGFLEHSLIRFNLILCILFWCVGYKTQQIKTYYLCSLSRVNT